MSDIRQRLHNQVGLYADAYDAIKLLDGQIAALQAENAKQSEWAAIQEDVINHLKAENAELRKLIELPIFGEHARLERKLYLLRQACEMSQSIGGTDIAISIVLETIGEDGK